MLRILRKNGIISVIINEAIKMDNYIPPFEISNVMLTRISSIMEKITKLDNYYNLDKTPYLRKQTRINSIHSSLATRK